MSRKLRYAFTAILTLAAVRPSFLAAGPSFNSYRESLQKDSREAGRLLQEGFALYHGMLAALESNDLKAAHEMKSKALEKYDAALKLYGEIAERAPKQTLVVEKADKDQTEALGRLKAKLAAKKIQYPQTEKDLAELALSSVKELRAKLAETELTGDAKDLPALMRLTLANTGVEEIGIFVSIIWAMQSR